MATLPIVTLPDPILRKASKSIERVDDELRQLMDDMLETMYAAPGLGLAANQVGTRSSAFKTVAIRHFSPERTPPNESALTGVE